MSSEDSGSAEQKAGPPTPMGFCWVEVPVKDMSRALKFYNEVFGWTCKEPDSFYCLVESPYGNLNGALRAVGEDDHVTGTPNAHTIKSFIGIRGINEHVEKIKKAGGEVVSPGFEIPNNMGFVAEWYDSERNLMGIWSAKM